MKPCACAFVILLAGTASCALAAPPGGSRCEPRPQFSAGTISGPETACVGSTVTFNATVATDYDTCDDTRTQEQDTVSVVTWHYGDGTSGSSNSHVYANPGTYSVTAVYADGNDPANDSDQTSSAITIHINPTTFSVNITGDTGPTRGDIVTYTATTTPAVYNATYAWQFHELNGSVTFPGPNSASWGGTMVRSGTLSVTVTTACGSASKSVNIGVFGRSWSDSDHN